MDRGRRARVPLARGLALGALLSGCAAPPVEPALPALNVSAGAIEALDDPAPRLGVEYRFRPMGAWRLGPNLGVALSSEATLYVYADLRREFWLDEHWVLTPRAGVSAFFEDTDIDLGNTLEFRTGFEIQRRLRNGTRLGLGFFHLSNAGLGDRNPGTEEIVVSWTVPIGAPAAAAGRASTPAAAAP